MNRLVPGTEDHARAIVPLMSEFDRGELEALAGDPVQCMINVVRQSIICRCALIEDQPAFLGGGSTDGLVWMISTPAVAKARKFYLRTTRFVADEMQALLPVMRTQIDVRYCRSLRWVQWLGFSVGDPVQVMGRWVCPIVRMRHVD